MSILSKSHTWIGMAHVRPVADPDLLEGCPGAYVSVLVLAQNEAEYGTLARSTLSEMGFSVIEFEDVEPLEARMKSGAPETDLLELARSLAPDQPVAVGTFDAYEEDDGVHPD